MEGKKVLITGVAGFVGYSLAERLLNDGYIVLGIDNMNSYYDPRIKRKRLSLLRRHTHFSFIRADIAKFEKVHAIFEKEKPQHIVHLAAQAGVRYSITNPWSYAESNFLGSLNVFEAARKLGIKRVIYASSSSVYGANTKQPFSETDRVDSPMSLYAVTKRANELQAHAYNSLYGIEMIGLRFFTVYGPWGRPDMALFKFARKIVSGKQIELYNFGKMRRSFTYIDDIVEPIARLIESPVKGENKIYNLGGAEAVPLMRFVELIEKELGEKAQMELVPIQAGDVPDTIADISREETELGYRATVGIDEGISRFMQWFKSHKKFLMSLEEPKQ